MKQSFYAIGMLILIVCNQATAQNSETAFLTRNSIYSSPLLLKVAGVAVSPAADAEVSATAAENFRRDFKDVKDVEWVKIAKGYRAYFQHNEILTAVDYDKKGKLYSIIRYGKNLMTKDLQEMIENSFVSPELREVCEVKIADYASRVYIIIIEDKESMKTVQILDGGMKVLNEIRK